MPDVDRCVAEAVQAFLHQKKSGDEPPIKVSLFAEAPHSPLARALGTAGLQLAQEIVDLRIVFATNNMKAVHKFAVEVEKIREDWASVVRMVEPSRYPGCNEQLVLGSWGYVSGPTINQVRRRRDLDIAQVSNSSQEVATASFAFELLWRTSTSIVRPDPRRQNRASLAVFLSGLSVGSIARLAIRA